MLGLSLPLVLRGGRRQALLLQPPSTLSTLQAPSVTRFFLVYRGGLLGFQLPLLGLGCLRACELWVPFPYHLRPWLCPPREALNIRFSKGGGSQQRLARVCRECRRRGTKLLLKPVAFDMFLPYSLIFRTKTTLSCTISSALRARFQTVMLGVWPRRRIAQPLDSPTRQWAWCFFQGDSHKLATWMQPVTKHGIRNELQTPKSTNTCTQGQGSANRSPSPLQEQKDKGLIWRQPAKTTPSSALNLASLSGESKSKTYVPQNI